ncbi:MAG TPA: sugar transferase [Alicyclobacillus sp.]|nr:sugar transferase [Alicyclobacillus sp.]
MLKRLFDIVVSSFALVILSPLLLGIAVAIRIDSPGPALFRQVRAGKDGVPFVIFKYRTMVTGAESLGDGVYTGQSDPRITRVGALLRRYSLDELPQLINILRGDMSIVGPRPTLMEQVERYTADQRERLRVRPGITGWAQINGRNEITWDERIELDRWYVHNWSFWLDLKILFRTIGVVVRGNGVYADKEKFVLGGESVVERREHRGS